MSVDYAAGLSDYDDLGVCGLDEILDPQDEVDLKVQQLSQLITEFKGSCVIHAGAGLSTAAGIPDFRGKNGVWTKLLQRKNSGQQPDEESTLEHLDKKPKKESLQELSDSIVMDDNSKVKAFQDAEPTQSHMALRELCRKGFISYIISQNVDGLFLRSGLERKYISELHGDFYLDECTCCKSRFIRSEPSKTMKLTKSDIACGKIEDNNNNNDCDIKKCKGHLRDTILDWESPIPYNELRLAEKFSKQCKLHICIGTSLQLKPSKDLVCNPSKNKKSKLVVINLQKTHLDDYATLKISYYADYVMTKLMEILDLKLPNYERSQDPTREPLYKPFKKWLR